MSDPAVPSDLERRAYVEERAFWLRAADGHFDEALLPFIRWHQAQVVARLAPPRDALVAEVGCGPGRLLADWEQLLLIDFSPAILARARASNPRALAVCASVDALPFRDGALAHIVANNMLHHVKGEGLLKPALSELARVLGRDGRMYINDRNPTLLHHCILALGMTAKRVLRMGFGEFPGCGSWNEPLFTRSDWSHISQHFSFDASSHYYTAGMWLVDSVAKGLAVLLRRRDRRLVAAIQSRSLPALLWLERHFAPAWLCLERSVVARTRRASGAGTSASGTIG